MNEKQNNGSIKSDRISKYFGLIILALILSSGIVILKLRNTQPVVETEPENLVDFSTVMLNIETDKEEYELGESIDTSIYVYNPTSEDVWILPIPNYNVDAYCVNDPELTRLAVSDSYPSGSYIKIEANGRYAVDHQTFKPEFPGMFRITCMGVTKTVKVTGESDIIPAFNIMPVRFGSVKPPLFYSQYFDNKTIRPEPIQLKGIFELGLIPLIEDGSVITDGGALRVERGYVFVDSTEKEYIILSDRDKPIYSPPSPSQEIAMLSIIEVTLDSEQFVEGYWFNHTLGDMNFRVLRPYWIGNVSMIQLVEKARNVMIDGLGDEYVTRNFVLFPSFYGYQVYNNPDSYWNYAIMFNHIIRINDYIQMNEVTVYFDSNKEHVRTDRLPQPNNLQPYNVTQTEAILYAIQAGIPDDAHTYEVRILYWEKVRSDDTPIYKYVWVVSAWLMEPYSNGSVSKIAYVDPHTGEVYGLDEVSVHSTA